MSFDISNTRHHGEEEWIGTVNPEAMNLPALSLKPTAYDRLADVTERYESLSIEVTALRMRVQSIIDDGGNKGIRLYKKVQDFIERLDQREMRPLDSSGVRVSSDAKIWEQFDEQTFQLMLSNGEYRFLGTEDLKIQIEDLEQLIKVQKDEIERVRPLVRLHEQRFAELLTGFQLDQLRKRESTNIMEGDSIDRSVELNLKASYLSRTLRKLVDHRKELVERRWERRRRQREFRRQQIEFIENMAAMLIQKVFRGWIYRKELEHIRQMEEDRNRFFENLDHTPDVLIPTNGNNTPKEMESIPAYENQKQNTQRTQSEEEEQPDENQNPEEEQSGD